MGYENKAFFIFAKIKINKSGKMKLTETKKAKLSIVEAVISIVLIVALVPIIVVFSAGTQQCLEDATPYLMDDYDLCCNATDQSCDGTDLNVSSTNSLSTTERTMLGLIALFVILAFIFNLVKSSGLTNKK